MRVPPMDHGGTVSGHGFIFQDKIFQNFVHGMAGMDVPIGKRRPVMQDKQRLILFHQGLIESLLFPFFQHLWFTRRQVCPHGKIALWQIERRAVIDFFHYTFTSYLMLPAQAANPFILNYRLLFIDK